MNSKWIQRYLRLAKTYSSWSKDNSTKVGAVIVRDRREVSLGYNGPPRLIDDSKVPTERPEKYMWYEHAERNAIYNAAYHGISTKDSTIFIYTNPNTVFMCSDCARAIIQSGIKEVYINKQDNIREDWLLQKATTESLLEQAGVKLTEIEYEQPAEDI